MKYFSMRVNCFVGFFAVARESRDVVFVRALRPGTSRLGKIRFERSSESRRISGEVQGIYIATTETTAAREGVSRRVMIE